jgi:hypothetical protein
MTYLATNRGKTSLPDQMNGVQVVGGPNPPIPTKLNN